MWLSRRHTSWCMEDKEMRHFSDYATLYMNKVQRRDGRKAASCPSIRKTSSLSIKTSVITLSAIAATVHKAPLPNHLNWIWKNYNGFRRNRSTILQILTQRLIIKGVRAKNYHGDTFVCRITRGIWFHTQGKEGTNSTGIWSLQRCCYR